MIILEDTPFYKAWEAYKQGTSQRIFQYGALTIFLIIYFVLMLFARTPEVAAYNGIDMWYWLVDQVPFGGTLIVSLSLILWMGEQVVKDKMGIKTSGERREDKEKKKKDKNFKPKPKSPVGINPYYAGYMVLEGIVYGSLIFALLPDALSFVFHLFGDSTTMPKPFDAIASLWAYHSNGAQDIALAFGAGVYEELIFRALLFMVIIYVAKNHSKTLKFLKQFNLKEDSMKPFPLRVPKVDFKDKAVIMLYVLGAAIYAASHFFLPFGDRLSLFGFLYRMFFGLILSYIFVRRGPAMAAWTHVVYDLLYFGLRWFM